MGSILERERHQFVLRQRELRTRYSILEPRKRDLLASASERIILGVDPHNCIFAINDGSRYLHLWVIGVPGSGKSTFFASGIRQDIINGSGVVVLDLAIPSFLDIKDSG